MSSPPHDGPASALANGSTLGDDLSCCGPLDRPGEVARTVPVCGGDGQEFYKGEVDFGQTCLSNMVINFSLAALLRREKDAGRRVTVIHSEIISAEEAAELVAFFNIDNPSS